MSDSLPRIIVVEDDQYLRRVMERAFRFAGHAVSLASDGEEALRQLSDMQTIPAAMLVDILMPNMDGLSFVTSVRKNRRYDAVPILILTNSFRAERAEECLAAGADRYMMKFDHTPKEIVRAVESLIKDKAVGIKGTPLIMET